MDGGPVPGVEGLSLHFFFFGHQIICSYYLMEGTRFRFYICRIKIT